MKITDIRAFKVTGRVTMTWDNADRACGPLDLYEEFNLRGRDQTKRTAGQEKQVSLSFIEIHTDEGTLGHFGPIVYPAQIFIILNDLKPLLLGRDPLDTDTLWDIMSRYDRHARTGMVMMAISAADNALWDLKGNYYGKPVYQLLGGSRRELQAYGSMLGNSTLPERAGEIADKVKNMGHAAQKWFFPWGPRSGQEGVERNLSLAAAVREAVGEHYPLMFDAWMGWDVAYAEMICKKLIKYNPSWLEEPLMPQMLDGYRELKKRVNVPLAAGEHFYTAWECKPYLEEGLLAALQADPDWCGGITEIKKIGELCRLYGIPLMPHGCGVVAAAHTVAALPPSVCPWVEYLFIYQEQQTCLFKNPIKPENGVIVMPDAPGLGMELDETKVESRVEIQF